MQVELKTKRLRLRPFVAEDAPAVAAGVGNINVAHYLDPVRLPFTKEMAETWIAGLLPPTAERMTLAIECDGQGLIGAIGLESGLGYWLAEPFWGVGYASEACRAVLSTHFAQTDAETVSSSVHVDNPASRNVQRKLGFVEGGMFEKFSAARNRPVPHVATQLTRTAFGRGV